MNVRTIVPSAALPRGAHLGGERGFTMIEMLVAMVILLIVMGMATSGLLQFSNTQSTVWNRAGMHDAVRSATELLQQEVGQAGKVSLPPWIRMLSAVSPGANVTVTVTSSSNIFVGERLVVDAGPNEETVLVTAVPSTTSFTAESFSLPHTGGNTPLAALGGFATGVVPTSVANGSTGSVLKIYGDVNSDNNMVYVEYVCDTANGFLYRNMVGFKAATKPTVTAANVLLSNLLPNPGGTPCFTYEQKTVNTTPYVVNVAISLTTRTQQVDKVTRQFQTETKALLNVAPRNVFDAWQLASIGAANRIQPMPPSVLALLP